MISLWEKQKVGTLARERRNEEETLNPTLALVSVCGDISPSLQVMNLEFLQ
jgi:hypothetical protein